MDDHVHDVTVSAGGGEGLADKGLAVGDQVDLALGGGGLGTFPGGHRWRPRGGPPGPWEGDGGLLASGHVEDVTPVGIMRQPWV